MWVVFFLATCRYCILAACVCVCVCVCVCERERMRERERKRERNTVSDHGMWMFSLLESMLAYTIGLGTEK